MFEVEKTFGYKERRMGLKKSLTNLKCVGRDIFLVLIHGFNARTSYIPSECQKDVWRGNFRSEIIYFAQLFICVALIITFQVMLALHDPNREYWVVVLSSLVGYIMHSPHMSQNKVWRKTAMTSSSYSTSLWGSILDGQALERKATASLDFRTLAVPWNL